MVGSLRIGLAMGAQCSLVNEMLERFAGERARAPVTVEELDGEELVISGHRDGAAFDSAIADMRAVVGVSGDWTNRCCHAHSGVESRASNFDW